MARTVVHDGLCKWTSAFVFLERSGVQFLQESQECFTFNCKLNLKAVECYIIKVFFAVIATNKFPRAVRTIRVQMFFLRKKSDVMDLGCTV